MAHYALVEAGSDPLVLQDQQTSNVRSQLLNLFEYYAELYPNPRLMEEFRLRETLLQAASAASSAQQRPKPAKGWFSRMFSSQPDATPPTADHPSQQESSPTPTGPTLIYSDISSGETGDDSLCGTQQSLDVSAIPDEAYAVARFHLASQRTREQHPNALQWGPMIGRPLPTNVVLVGLGLLAEFQPNQPSTVHRTSDRSALMDYAARYPGDFQLSYARACAISPNCIAVSWGFTDGLLGIYRRMAFPPDGKDKYEVGWELMWMVGPSRPVLDAIGDVFHDDPDHPGSPLLRVSQILPLRVETGDRRQPLIATLAISRLGGYVELLPVPTGLWFGPVLTPENHRPSQPPKSKSRKPQHYSVGYNIGSPTLPLNTPEFHGDILAMEALRTRVGPDSSWDQESFPEAPPSEFILAVSGQSRQGGEAISFWTISTLFPDEQPPPNAPPFQIHSTLLDVVSLSTGPDISVFCTPSIMRHWRAPRHVELDPNAPLQGQARDDSPPHDRITTISISAPIVNMLFDGAASPNSQIKLAVLDWNGGIDLLDCSTMERLGSQQLTQEELPRFRAAVESRGEQPFPLLHIVASRTEIAQALSAPGRSILAFQWLAGIASEGSDCAPFVLFRDPPELAIVSLSLDTDSPNSGYRADVVSMPFSTEGTTLGDLGNGNISFVMKSTKGGSSVLKLRVMQQLQPTDIVESLANECKYEEAVVAARKLDDLDQASLADILEQCHRRIWETKQELESLAETKNIEYIVEQTLHVCEPEQSTIRVPLKELRDLCQLAITMGRAHRPSADSLYRIRGLLIKLGTYELLCERFSVEPSSQAFWEEFIEARIESIGFSAARRGDIHTLSILVFRHGAELANARFEILGATPLTVRPDEFVHLIPIIKDSRWLDTFFPEVESVSPLHWSQMPHLLLESRGLKVTCSEKDEQLVLDYNSTRKGDAPVVTADWFVARANQLQRFTGNMHEVAALCKLGLRCFGVDVTEINAVSIPNDLLQLFKTWRSSTALYRILLEETLEFEDAESHIFGPVVVNTEDLLSMDAEELVDLVLGAEDDSNKLVTRCTELIQPILVGPGDEDGKRLGEALVNYCKKLIVACSDPAHDKSSTEAAVMKSLLTCLAIGKSSCSSLQKNIRLIKDKFVVSTLVLDVIEASSMALSVLELETTTTRSLLDLVGEFSLLATLLETPSETIDRERTKTDIIDFLENAIFSDDHDESNWGAAIKCQDTVGQIFPEVQATFAAIRKYLDASHFIATVIYEGNASMPIGPTQLRRQLPLDIIETVLRSAPDCVVRGCPQWRDKHFSQNANRSLRASSDVILEPDNVADRDRPVLPAGAIFHLATLLGLEDSNSALIVQSRVIHYALSIGLHGAAAAICRSIVCQTDSSEVHAAAQRVKLAMVAKVVSNDDYTDLETKMELCQSVLRLGNWMLDEDDMDTFDKVCAVATSLEFQTSRYSSNLPGERKRALLNRPIARLELGTLHEYNASIQSLVVDLESQASDNRVHDSLMNALSRFVIYWCISDSKALKTRRVAMESTDACENLLLGCALILHIPSNLTASNCVHELQKIASDQAAIVANEERFVEKDDILIPDPEIVKRLVGRGYSTVAAQRSTVMTRNAGYDQALGWAVAHTLDADFNAPIVLVADGRKKYVDDLAIHRLHSSLRTIEQALDDGSILQDLLLSVANGRRGGGSTIVSHSLQSVPPRVSIEKKSRKTGTAHRKKTTNEPASHGKPESTEHSQPSKAPVLRNISTPTTRPTLTPSAPVFHKKSSPPPAAKANHTTSMTTSVQPVSPTSAPTSSTIDKKDVQDNTLSRKEPLNHGEFRPPRKQAAAQDHQELTENISASEMSLTQSTSPETTVKFQQDSQPSQFETETKDVSVSAPSNAVNLLGSVKSSNGSNQKKDEAIVGATSSKVETIKATRTPSVAPTAKQRMAPTGSGNISAEKREELLRQGRSVWSKRRNAGTPVAGTNHPPPPPPRNVEKLGATSEKATQRHPITFPASTAKPISTVDREALLKRGQEAVSRLRSAGVTVDRQKLIEEGKALFRNSRMKTGPPSVSPSAAASGGACKTSNLVPEVETGAPGKQQTEVIPEQDQDDGNNSTGWDFDNFDDM
eukprot:Nitzschia sp. Nitz4//scaffold3_size479765//460000//466728//NITZ4_000193-RA/size479765-augustus-gene-1.589-mRNA-1//1//CDS//3329551037//8142//frame0